MRFKDMDEERKKIDELAKAHQNLRLEGGNYLIRPFQNMVWLNSNGKENCCTIYPMRNVTRMYKYSIHENLGA